METSEDDEDKNVSVDEFFTPLVSSFPGELVFLFLLGVKTWKIVRHLLDDEW